MILKFVNFLTIQKITLIFYDYYQHFCSEWFLIRSRPCFNSKTEIYNIYWIMHSIEFVFAISTWKKLTKRWKFIHFSFSYTQCIAIFINLVTNFYYEWYYEFVWMTNWLSCSLNDKKSNFRMTISIRLTSPQYFCENSQNGVENLSSFIFFPLNTQFWNSNRVKCVWFSFFFSNEYINIKDFFRRKVVVYHCSWKMFQ